jgi:hypothetical protein
MFTVIGRQPPHSCLLVQLPQAAARQHPDCRPATVEEQHARDRQGHDAGLAVLGVDEPHGQVQTGVARRRAQDRQALEVDTAGVDTLLAGSLRQEDGTPAAGQQTIGGCAVGRQPGQPITHPVTIAVKTEQQAQRSAFDPGVEHHVLAARQARGGRRTPANLRPSVAH